jgi:phosphoserine phosphatase
MNKLKLVVFDVDGTLIKTYSSWQHLHEHLGTWNRGRRHAEQYHRGNITYLEWARLDASLWKGIPLQRIQQIIDRIPYMDGAREAILALRKAGFKVVLLSAGLSLIMDRISREIGVDDSLANELIVKDGSLTGNVRINVSFNSKDEAIQSILQRFDAKLGECAAIGDDETMIPLFEKVSLRIAFNPRNKHVEEHADVVIRSKDLREALPHLLK